MSAPKLFLHTRDTSLASGLLALSYMQPFDLVISNQDDCWLQQLEYSHCQLALVEVTPMDRGSLQALQHSAVFQHTEFLFFSQGTPDPQLDELMKKGAGFHFRAPFNFSLVDASLQEIYLELNRQTTQARSHTSHLDQFGLLVGSSSKMHTLYRTIRKVAATQANTLIIGESGTGKELIANTLHIFSDRADGPFVAINCGALSPELIDSELFGHVKGAFTGAYKDHDGVFEQARGGTLFLDEVTEMPFEQQVKLLRVLESGEFKPVGGHGLRHADVRIIAATNREPQDAIDAESFRADLYFRLAQFPIRVPPLRERDDDAYGLAQHFLAYRNAQDDTQKTLSESSIHKIRHYAWPGNIRELKHSIERACILASDTIEPEHLLFHHDANDRAEDNIPAGVRLEDLEKMAIKATLRQNSGNKTNTAAQLGITVKTLYNKLEKYGNLLN